LHGHWEEGTGAHSRLFERLIDEGYIVAGTSIKGGRCREHVVPFKVIRDRCNEYFSQGRRPEDVADFIQTHLKLVRITKEERDHLDFRLGLRDRMPTGWQEGDWMARLREAGIVLASEDKREKPEHDDIG
jgi:hypothetical protein